ncbi:protein-ribulosamine 3-kinase, chloroplastic-like isoform X5 [Nicotiana tabacum]|uniref:Protein-ribulosamine 3-kinase, chloroplastic-like isoform X5 n=1 Tax=Nicotiana tabacum TaxID=4097 RepID=A0AC58TAW0_TOBAC
MVVAHLGAISFSSCIPNSLSCPRLMHPSINKNKPLIVAAMSDDPIREWILSEGKATQIRGICPIGGGCINRATRYDTDAGSFFVKTNRSIGPSMFEGEALGLNSMYETGSIRVPKPYKVGSLPTGGSYIIMEFIEFGASRGNQSALGRKLAEMHKAAKSEKGFGFHVENTIGSTPQINTWTSDWIEFYAEHRLGKPLAAMSDDPIREWILSEGKATQIRGICPIGGGCINRATRYDTDAGSFFVKTNRSIGPSMFEGEALGLNSMYETGSIRVPKPYKVGSLPTGGSYIIMEFIEFGASRGNQHSDTLPFTAFQSALGRKLAEMHKAAKSEKGFGFHVENTIGSTPQINTWTSDWIEFYAEHRLGYQLKLAREQYGDSTIYERGQRLAKNLGPLFKNVVIEPCLLHGDLWSGNITYDKNGEPVILDPACYYGHSEAEFGMSWCAGFGGDFYKAYFQVMPEQPGFEQRRDLYMLYHYLNHYNLFGSGYRSSSLSIIDDYLRMLNV